MPMQTGSAGLHALRCRPAKESYKAGRELALERSTRSRRARGIVASGAGEGPFPALPRYVLPLCASRDQKVPLSRPRAAGRPARTGSRGTEPARRMAGVRANPCSTLTLGVLRSWSRWCQVDVRAHGGGWRSGRAYVQLVPGPGHAQAGPAATRPARRQVYVVSSGGGTHRYGPHQRSLLEGVHWIGRTAIILSR